MNKKLAEFIRNKILRGWPDTPLLNHDKSWCQVPTTDQLTKWIDEFNTPDPNATKHYLDDFFEGKL